ncbi:MAG: hypothetical protein M3077_06880 [Candidatus Dormibacteraeota bacterium]|nr:hypothetical protein [Candidatus Dormibacteraeota bacterium]
MSEILRQLSAFGGRVLLGVVLFALLTPPFGLRAFLEARAQDQAVSARVLQSFGRPAASVVKAPTSARPFVQQPRSPLDGIAGKGAWFMIFDGEWTDPDADRAAALVDSAVRADLSHVYVRIADSPHHFYAAAMLQDLLPIAHARGLKVIGWIEPMLDDPGSDASDAIAAANFEEQGQRLDGLALTIEGNNTSDPNVGQYLAGVRSGAAGLNGLGDQYLLIASTLPTPYDHPGYAYATMSRYCQVFAPMAYWRATGLPQYSGTDGARAYIDQVFQQFRDPGVNPFKRPLTITAQAYDAAPEYGTPGAPPASEITTSMDETRAQGGISWSYYRLADATNGVTGDEQQAISGYRFWQRSVGPAIAAKALIALPDQPVAY